MAERISTCEHLQLVPHPDDQQAVDDYRARLLAGDDSAADDFLARKGMLFRPYCRKAEGSCVASLSPVFSGGFDEGVLMRAVCRDGYISTGLITGLSYRINGCPKREIPSSGDWNCFDEFFLRRVFG